MRQMTFLELQIEYNRHISEKRHLEISRADWNYVREYIYQLEIKVRDAEQYRLTHTQPYPKVKKR